MLLGSRYWREGGARPRDAAWHNGMSAAQLHTQRLRETTLAQPTWALTHAAFAAAGGYNEEGPNNAEDLQLFYAHLAAGGVLHRVDELLVMYRRVFQAVWSCSVCASCCVLSALRAARRHTADGVCATRGVPQALIWALRVAQLELVLAQSPWVRACTSMLLGALHGHHALTMCARAARGVHDLERGQRGARAVQVAERARARRRALLRGRGRAQAGARRLR